MIVDKIKLVIMPAIIVTTCSTTLHMCMMHFLFSTYNIVIHNLQNLSEDVSYRRPNPFGWQNPCGPVTAIFKYLLFVNVLNAAAKESKKYKIIDYHAFSHSIIFSIFVQDLVDVDRCIFGSDGQHLAIWRKFHYLNGHNIHYD